MPNFKSGLERQFAKKTKNKFDYEAATIEFTQPAAKRKYKPDFKISDCKFIETKGRLTSQDRAKHLWIKEQRPEIEVYFVFSRPHNRIRKGSPTTYADWCDKHGFEWISIDDPLPKHWSKG